MHAVRRQGVSCATRPACTDDPIGRGRSRCSTWTIGVRSLLPFGASAWCAPSAVRGSDVQEGCAEGGPVGAPYTWRLRDEKRVPGAAKVRFLAVAEKTAMRGVSCKQKFFTYDLNSRNVKRSFFRALVFYVHDWVRGLTGSPLFFYWPRNRQKTAKNVPPPPTKKRL